LIRRMALDLNLPVEILGVPTVREADGLALSSRNRYLGPEARISALSLSRALAAGARQDSPGRIRAAALAELGIGAAAEPPVELDYLALVDPSDFTEVGEGHRGPAVLAVAAKVGGTRLIDNLPLEIGEPGAAAGAPSARNED